MQDYKREIYKFIENYFAEIDEISEFHLNFFIKNQIKTIELDMLLVYKFIFQAFNFLRSNTGLYFSRFCNKLFKDIEGLLNYLSMFEKKTKVLNTIFEIDFLQNLPEYKILKEKVDENNKLLHSTSANIASLETQIKFFNPKTKEDEDELKRLRGRLVDAIHYNAKAKENISVYNTQLNELKSQLRDEFMDEFMKAKDSYLSRLKLVINTKLYYFNKKMWIEANESKKTQKYLEDLGIDKIDLKIYIENYLKHIDIARSKNYEQFSKIEELLKLL